MSVFASLHGDVIAFEEAPAVKNISFSSFMSLFVFVSRRNDN